VADLINTLDSQFERYAQAVGKGAGWYAERAGLAAIEGRNDLAVEMLQEAADRGYFYDVLFDDPVFDKLQGSEAFEVTRRAVADRHAAYRKDVLSLICDDNPIPDHWRPLESSCAMR
jgi:hypothetical protein